MVPLCNLQPLQNMMMTTTPCEECLRSPRQTEMNSSLSVKRPSLSPLKRKLSDEEDTTSPTATDELVMEESVISPKKKVKTELIANVLSCALALEDVGMEDDLDAACKKVLEAYCPVPFESEPAEGLNDEEVDILTFFLS